VRAAAAGHHQRVEAGPIGFSPRRNRFALDAAIARVDGPGGALCLIVVRDVTEQRRQDDERDEQLRRAQAERARRSMGPGSMPCSPRSAGC